MNRYFLVAGDLDLLLLYDLLEETLLLLFTGERDLDEE